MWHIQKLWCTSEWKKKLKERVWSDVRERERGYWPETCCGKRNMHVEHEASSTEAEKWQDDEKETKVKKRRRWRGDVRYLLSEELSLPWTALVCVWCRSPESCWSEELVSLLCTCCWVTDAILEPEQTDSSEETQATDWQLTVQSVENQRQTLHDAHIHTLKRAYLFDLLNWSQIKNDISNAFLCRRAGIECVTL